MALWAAQTLDKWEHFLVPNGQNNLNLTLLFSWEASTRGRRHYKVGENIFFKFSDNFVGIILNSIRYNVKLAILPQIQ